MSKRVPTKGDPYICNMCKQESLLFTKPFEGLVFQCFNCDEAVIIEEIIYLTKDLLEKLIWRFVSIKNCNNIMIQVRKIHVMSNYSIRQFFTRFYDYSSTYSYKLNKFILGIEHLHYNVRNIMCLITNIMNISNEFVIWTFFSDGHVFYSINPFTFVCSNWIIWVGIHRID